MPPKRKNPEEGPSTPSQPRTSRRSRSTKDDGSATPIIKPETKTEPRPLKIQWDPNERWTDRLIEYLTNHLDVRLKMFSNCVKDAKKESRKKIVGSKPKVEYYREIARAVFDVEGEVERGAYLMEPERYATSVLGRITYLQKTYTTYRKTLQTTGEGLNAWWSEHPTYAFRMVTNSTSGTRKMVSDLEQAPQQVAEEANTPSHPFSPPPEPPSTFQPPLPHVNSPLPWAEPAPQADQGLLNTSSPLFRIDMPLPDFIAEFHEATRVDQAQAQQEAQYYHAYQMARLELKKEKMRHKYEIESLKLQLQLAQVQSQQPQQEHPPVHHHQ